MRRSGLAALLSATCAAGTAGASCGDDTVMPLQIDGGVDATAADSGPHYEAAAPEAGPPRVAVAAELVTTRVDAQGMFFAAGEMQISGEPFAEFFAGRNLNFYDRAFLPANMYLVPVPGDAGVFDQLLGIQVNPVRDLFGFSTAVESYEYSKYHMNSVIEWGGAGVSLASGPLVAALGQGSPQANLIARVTQLLTLAGTDVGGYAVLPPPTDNPLNILGFAGLVPTFAPYRAFDPAVAASTQVVQSCNRAGGYGGIPTLGQETPEYECEYNQLHLPDAQLDHSLVPAVLGFGTWKQALWSIDFAGRIHDSGSTQVNAIQPSDEPYVGTRQNGVIATDPPGALAGTYLGSTPLEGMWGMVMLAGMDNLAEWTLTSLTTADGAKLGGFASGKAAVTYDFASPLRWFPAAITVGVDAAQAFPPVTSLTIGDPTSRSVDLSALLLGNAMLFAMTDSRNAGIVGSHLGLQIAFDGAHSFAADDGLPDGEATTHDRALGVLRVALVDLVRIHADPAIGVLHDTATIGPSGIVRGGAVSTVNLAHALIGLRQTVLSLNAAITQYGSAAEDPSGDVLGILNSVPIHPPGAGTPPFSSYVRDVFVTNAAFVRDLLTTSTGQVASGASLSGGRATLMTGPATLDVQAAAARALTEAFLLTGDTSYRDRARAVIQHLFSGFFSRSALMFRGVDGGPDEVDMTPELFGWLESALRETYEALYLPGDPVLDRPPLQSVIQRVIKLYLNGWDDLDGDQLVEGPMGGPNECLGARMQLAEQSLTGELGRDSFGLPTPDRDSDCVVELGHAQSLSVFAGDVHFHSP